MITTKKILSLLGIESLANRRPKRHCVAEATFAQNATKYRAFEPCIAQRVTTRLFSSYVDNVVFASEAKPSHGTSFIDEIASAAPRNDRFYSKKPEQLPQRLLQSLRSFAMTLHLICLFAIASQSVKAASVKELEDAYDKSQWDEATEMAYEMLSRGQSGAIPKLKGAYSLFQKGYSNSALLFLKRMTISDWKQIPQGYERLMEIVSLFQKKVPLNELPSFKDQITPESVAPNLREEVRFSLGRRAYEKQNFPTAKQYLGDISRSSRFFSEARYLLATIAVKEKNYDVAAQEFSKIFDSQVLDQATEFWKDFSSQTSKDWGPSVHVQLEQDFLSANERLGELAIIGVARTQYATKEFEKALANYDRIGKQSRYYPRVALERIWTLLSLNRNDEAEQAAQALSFADNTFESIEAKPLRALILADSGKTEQARQILQDFFTDYDASKGALEKFKRVMDPRSLPPFMHNDLELDQPMVVRNEFSKNVQTEIDKLNSEDKRLYPVYSYLAGNLAPLVTNSKNEVSKFVQGHVERRMRDLERLYAQAKLIKVETYLEDREQLRNEFKLGNVTDPEKQKEHDTRLTALLESAVKEADEVSGKTGQRNLNLEFRQSELLWELSSAHAILFQTSKDPKDDKIATALKLRSLKIAEEIVTTAPNYTRRGQALFFTGFAEIDLGKDAGGVKKLRQFVQQYPKDNHVADAYRILGDIDFDANRFAEAEASYHHVLEWQDSNIIGYALYKLGWCAYNGKNFSKAILALEQAIVWNENLDSNHHLLNLEREARRDLISIYAEVGDTTKAAEYFQNFLHGDSSPWILELARELERSGQYEKTAELYQTLITMNPTSASNLEYQGSIIWGYYRLHQWPQLEKATKDLLDLYASQLTTPQTGEVPAATVEKHLHEAVMVHHKEFKDSTAPEDKTRMLDLDNLYLALFKEWPESESVLNEHAYYLSKIKETAEAAKAYREHWVRFQAKLDPTQREEGLRDLIHTLELLEGEEKAKTETPSATVNEIVELAALYEKDYPGTKYTRPIVYLASALLFKYNAVEKGILASQKMFDQNAQDDFGKRAFQNLRTAYYKEKNWKKTYDWASDLASRKFPGREFYAKDLQTIREESVFLWAENTEDNPQAADLYMKIADMSDMRRLWDKSLYNAFIRYQKAGKKVEALSAANRLEGANQKFDGLSDISGIRAAFYQEAGDYQTALPLLLTFLAKTGKDTPIESVQQARLSAGLIAEATERYGDATTLFNQYVANGAKGTPGGVEEARRALARINAKTQRTITSVDKPWEKLLNDKKAYEKEPLPKKGDLAGRIQEGGNKLEKLSTQFLTISTDPKASQTQAFEAYCAVPLLYGAYEKSLQTLGTSLPPEVRVELAKISDPIGAKAKELGEECLKKSVEAEHNGPIYHEINKLYGWEHSPETIEKVKKTITMLDQRSPWLDSVTNSKTEEQIIKSHLENQGTGDSWYALARLRCERKAIDLCRLTLVDALQKSKDATGRVLNALAVISERKNDTKGLTSLYTQAAAQGSPMAWSNLALFHLKAGRLAPGLEAMHRAAEAGVYANYPDILAMDKDWTPTK
jgi:tetratricopeptide (TPR) repeat protein